MNLRKCSIFIAVFFALTLTILSTSAAQAEGFFYRIAPPLGGVTCSTGSFGPEAVLSLDHREYNLPSGAIIMPYILLNDDSPIPRASFAGPVGTGTENYVDTFRSGGIPFPVRIGLRLDTVINGGIVYRSTLMLDCPGEGAGTVSVSNGVVGGGGGSAINDGRINAENYAPVALYCDGSVLTAYAIDTAGQGTKAWDFDFKNASTDSPLITQLGVALSTTADGRYSILAPQHDGKQYLFIFKGCPAPGATETYISDPATGEFVRTE